jgi:hypothetical protein
VFDAKNRLIVKYMDNVLGKDHVKGEFGIFKKFRLEWFSFLLYKNN